MNGTMVQTDVTVFIELRGRCPKCRGTLKISNEGGVNSQAIWMNCGGCGYFGGLTGKITVGAREEEQAEQ